MKTICSLRRSGYLLLGLAAFAAVSCSSYRNSSYYDQDGIYGSDKQRVTEAASAQESDNPYKEYFGTLKRETEIFTNADNYVTAYDTTGQDERPRTGYGGWGSESDNVTVNIYGNNWGYWNNWNYWNSWYGPGWGWNAWYGGPYWSIGWGNWYGPSWGWGWASPYYGWGYNNWYSGFYTPHYGNHYIYQPGRRGSSYNPGARNTSVRQSSGRTYTRYNTGTRNSGFNGTRSQAPRSTRSDVGAPRTSQGTYSQPRQSGVRTQSAPTRDYSSPAPTGGTRSSGNFGGGGGRTSGSGGRR